MTRIISIAILTIFMANTAAHAYGKYDYASYSSNSSSSYKASTSNDDHGPVRAT